MGDTKLVYIVRSASKIATGHNVNLEHRIKFYCGLRPYIFLTAENLTVYKFIFHLWYESTQDFPSEWGGGSHVTVTLVYP